MTVLWVAGLLMQQVGWTAVDPALGITDYELRFLSVTWFDPPWEHGVDKRVRDPEIKRKLLALPREPMLDRLEIIREQTNPLDINSYTAMSFVLSYLGRDVLENAKRMFQMFYLRSLPENVRYLEWREGGGYPYPDYAYPFESHEVLTGLGDSVVQLYRRQSSPALLEYMLMIPADGEGGYFKCDWTQTLFLLYPSDVLAAAHRLGYVDQLGFWLAFESYRPARIEKTLAVMMRDKRSAIAEAAAKALKEYHSVY